MIRTTNLTKKYGNHLVLDDINLNINKGDVYGFLGQNGAGKSTTLNILTGLLNYNKGSVHIDRNSIGYLPETPMFYDFMTGYEYLSYIGQIKQHPSINKRIEEVLEIIGLKKAGKRRIKGYSRGMKQRLGLGSVLFHNPDILLLDEPSSALDPSGRKDILNIIDQQASQDKTIFFSTHILSDVERVCNRIGILHQSHLVLESTTEALNAQKESIIRLTVDDTQKALNHLKDLDYIDNIVEDKHNLLLHLKDKSNLLYDLSKLPIEVIGYQKEQETLEDLFIKVVK